MLAAGIDVRKREFAILESIGMTSKQIRAMLAWEGNFYAAVSLLGGMIIEIPFSCIVFDNLNTFDMKYQLPWQEIIVPYVIILLVCIATPRVVYHFTVKNSIIEGIKME